MLIYGDDNQAFASPSGPLCSVPPLSGPVLLRSTSAKLMTCPLFHVHPRSLWLTQWVRPEWPFSLHVHVCFWFVSLISRSLLSFFFKVNLSLLCFCLFVCRMCVWPRTANHRPILQDDLWGGDVPPPPQRLCHYPRHWPLHLPAQHDLLLLPVQVGPSLMSPGLVRTRAGALVPLWKLKYLEAFKGLAMTAIQMWHICFVLFQKISHFPVKEDICLLRNLSFLNRHCFLFLFLLLRLQK